MKPNARFVSVSMGATTKYNIILRMFEIVLIDLNNVENRMSAVVGNKYVNQYVIR